MQQGMQDLYARRRMEGVEAALRKISRYISVGRKVQPGQGVPEKLSTLHFRNNADQNAAPKMTADGHA